MLFIGANVVFSINFVPADSFRSLLSFFFVSKYNSFLFLAYHLFLVFVFEVDLVFDIIAGSSASGFAAPSVFIFSFSFSLRLWLLL